MTLNSKIKISSNKIFELLFFAVFLPEGAQYIGKRLFDDNKKFFKALQISLE